jgi:hypothetical protein
MFAVLPIEFLIRKTWFRYYYFGGPFDRFWSSFFPPEETERGRASLEYIRRFRAGELEVPKPPPRAEAPQRPRGRARR